MTNRLRPRCPGRWEVARGDVDRLYIVMPYLKTSRPVSVRGIRLVSSDQLDELSEDARAHLRSLCSMFYLRDEFRIRSMTCGVVDVKALLAKGINPDRRLWEVQTLLAFLHATPGGKPQDPWLRAEHATILRFLDKPVSYFAIWLSESKAVVGPHPDHEPMNISDSYVPGYEGWSNSGGYLHVISTSRIYPPTWGMWLNLYQDLSAQLAEAPKAASVQGRFRLLTGESFLPKSVEARAFLAMDWYNRSTTIATAEKAALVNLVVAFETLLSVDEEKHKADGMARSIRTLLGPIQRLDSWVEQFYKARSAIVHEGDHPYLDFLAVDRDQVPRALKGDVQAGRYRQLTDYGRLLFRLCLDTLLFGASCSKSHELDDIFRHNQERLETICGLLKRSETPPAKMLSEVGAQVDALEKYWLESEELVKLKTLFVAGKLILGYCAVAPGVEWPPFVRSMMEQITDESAVPDNETTIRLYKDLAQLLEEMVGPSSMTTGPHLLTSWADVVLEFSRYASSPSFALAAYSQDKAKRQGDQQ